MNTVLLRLASRNLMRRFRKNLVVAVLVAVGVAVFFFGNALIDSSLKGINRSFVQNFTGDMSVSAKSEEHFGIFGPDVPIISAYQQIPLLPEPGKVFAKIVSTAGVEKAAPVVSSPLVIDLPDYRSPALGIGTIASEYFGLFSNLRFVRGSAPVSDDKPWIVLPETRVAQIEKATGAPLQIGEPIILSMAHNSTFTIRELRFSGSIAYEPENESLSKTVVIDGKTLRDLSGLGPPESVPAQSQTDANSSPDSIDDLFGEGTDTFINEDGQGLNLGEIAAAVGAKKSAEPEPPLDHTGAWHFVLMRAKQGENLDVLAQTLKAGFSAEEGIIGVDVRDWRDTAGIVASYVFALQVIFYCALAMLGGIIIMITINSLVVSVIERSAEIGTMRAIGAQRNFIRMQFIAETMILCFLSAIFGVVLGMVGVAFLNSLKISIDNEILSMLFGASNLQVVYSPFSVISAFLAVLFVSAVAWIHPVRMALRIQPVQAMHTK